MFSLLYLITRSPAATSRANPQSGSNTSDSAANNSGVSIYFSKQVYLAFHTFVI